MILSKWIRDYGTRMDQALISLIANRGAYLRRLPQFVRLSAEKVMHKWIQIPVLVQWNSSHDHFFTPQSNPLHVLGFSVRQYFKEIQTFSLPITLEQIPALMTIPDVKKVYLDRKIVALLDTATATTRAPTVWKTHNQGETVTIAVLDTGITPHADLASRLIAFVDFVNGKEEPYDDNGHGTHCAGCAAGDGLLSNGKYRGPAPKAPLIGIKVLDKYGEGSLSKVIAGIAWCIQHKEKYNIRIISLSLGGDSSISYKEDPICQMVEQAWKEGIVVVAAAGNMGPKPKTISSPGIHPQIITVGAADDRRTVDRRDDRVASFSSRGPTLDGVAKPDLLAPGTNIVSLRSWCSYLDRSLSENRVGDHYFSMSGTSMATPIVAGIVALMLSADPTLTPDQIKQRLLKTSYSLHQPVNDQGAGQVDAEKALQGFSSS